MYPKIYFLSTYGIMAALGAITAILLFEKNRDHAHITENESTAIIFIGLVSGIIGARVYYVIQFYDEFFRYRSIWKIFKIWEGGLVFYGGPLLALLAIFIYCRHKKISFISVLDICAPAMAAAHAFGRIGCFLHGCCVSTITCAYPWGVTYPAGSEAAAVTGGAAVHPVQLYETLFNILLALPLFFLARKCRPGAAVGTYMFSYGIWRFIIEYWRNEPKYGQFSSAQYISMGFVLAGIILLAVSIFRKKHTQEEPQASDEKC